MKPRIMTWIVFTILFLLVDYYLFQAVIAVSKSWTPAWKTGVRIAFWIPTILSVAALMWWSFGDPYRVSSGLRNWIITALVATYFSKFFGILILFVDDLQRGVRWIANLFSDSTQGSLPGKPSRVRNFLPKLR